jgi:hypothetical protein
MDVCINNNLGAINYLVMKEETLYDKMRSEIDSNISDGITITAMACERVAIQAQIDECKSILKLSKRHMDDRAAFFLNKRIEKLEEKLS